MIHGNRVRVFIGGLALAGAIAGVEPAIASAASTAKLPPAKPTAALRVNGPHLKNPEFLGAIADFLVTYVAGKAVDAAVGYVTDNSPALEAATAVALAGLAATPGGTSVLPSGDAQFNAAS